MELLNYRKSQTKSTATRLRLDRLTLRWPTPNLSNRKTTNSEIRLKTSKILFKPVLPSPTTSPSPFQPTSNGKRTFKLNWTKASSRNPEKEAGRDTLPKAWMLWSPPLTRKTIARAVISICLYSTRGSDPGPTF